MRPGGGKQKGAQFERDVCVKLSRWVSQGKYEDVFWRSAMSGGRATVGRQKGKDHSSQAGDISAIRSIGEGFIDKFVPECKFYQDLNYEGLLVGTGKLNEFWAKLRDEARHYKKYPILFARQNRFPTFVGLNQYGVNLLLLEHKGYAYYPQLDLHLYEFDWFLTASTPYVSADWRPAPDRPRRRRIQVQDI